MSNKKYYRFKTRPKPARGGFRWEVIRPYGAKKDRLYHVWAEFLYRDDAWVYARMKNDE